jgi:hypothetical protein
MNSNGGWVASAVDLVRFTCALDQTEILNQETSYLMLSRPSVPSWDGTNDYYGLGWRIHPGKSLSYWHNCSMPGTSAFLYRRPDGMVWAALFNARPDIDGDEFLVGVIFVMGLAAMMEKIVFSSLAIIFLIILTSIAVYRHRKRRIDDVI